LNVGLWLRRDRLDMFPPATRHQRRNQTGKPLIGLFRFAQPPLYRRCTLVGNSPTTYVLGTHLGTNTTIYDSHARGVMRDRRHGSGADADSFTLYAGTLPPLTTVAEPASVTLLATGLIALGGTRSRHTARSEIWGGVHFKTSGPRDPSGQPSKSFSSRNASMRTSSFYIQGHAGHTMKVVQERIPSPLANHRRNVRRRSQMRPPSRLPAPVDSGSPV
jgi:hypothetical protein